LPETKLADMHRLPSNEDEHLDAVNRGPLAGED
jgi:hypothetical protein